MILLTLHCPARRGARSKPGRFADLGDELPAWAAKIVSEAMPEIPDPVVGTEEGGPLDPTGQRPVVADVHVLGSDEDVAVRHLARQHERAARGDQAGEFERPVDWNGGRRSALRNATSGHGRVPRAAQSASHGRATSPPCDSQPISVSVLPQRWRPIRSRFWCSGRAVNDQCRWTRSRAGGEQRELLRAAPTDKVVLVQGAACRRDAAAGNLRHIPYRCRHLPTFRHAGTTFRFHDFRPLFAMCQYDVPRHRAPNSGDR